MPAILSGKPQLISQAACQIEYFLYSMLHSNSFTIHNGDLLMISPGLFANCF